MVRKKSKLATLIRKIAGAFKKFVTSVGTLNIVLILVGIFFIIFHLQMLELYRTTGGIPESYAVTVTGALLGECGICGWIRTTKDRKREHTWEIEEKEKAKGDNNYES